MEVRRITAHGFNLERLRRSSRLACRFQCINYRQLWLKLSADNMELPCWNFIRNGQLSSKSESTGVLFVKLVIRSIFELGLMHLSLETPTPPPRGDMGH